MLGRINSVAVETTTEGIAASSSIGSERLFSPPCAQLADNDAGKILKQNMSGRSRLLGPLPVPVIEI